MTTNHKLTVKTIAFQLGIGTTKAQKIKTELHSFYNVQIITQKLLDKWLCID